MSKLCAENISTPDKNLLRHHRIGGASAIEALKPRCLWCQTIPATGRMTCILVMNGVNVCNHSSP